MFIQIHSLTGYSSVLLNRDDLGAAKSVTYGGYSRTRTSSQFAKRKLRMAEGAHALTDIGAMSIRSRQIFRDLIAKPLLEEGFALDDVVETVLKVREPILGKSPKAAEALKKKKEEAAGDDEKLDLLLSSIVAFGRPEVEFLLSQCRSILTAARDGNESLAEVCKRVLKENKKANMLVTRLAGLDTALFGRMVTGDLKANTDAAIHVAHGISCHASAADVDFFTAVDDLATDEGEAGSAHMGETEITSPLLYQYVVIDVPLLVSNISGIPVSEWKAGEIETAGRIVRDVVHLLATVIVGAKKGGTAPYSTADFVLVEAGRAQPRSLAEAFRIPCEPNLEAAVGALLSYLDGKDRMYGDGGVRRATASISGRVENAVTLDELAEFASKAVHEAA